MIRNGWYNTVNAGDDVTNDAGEVIMMIAPIQFIVDNTVVYMRLSNDFFLKKKFEVAVDCAFGRFGELMD